MELYQADATAEAQEQAGPASDPSIALPPFPVLLRVPNFGPRGRVEPTVKSMTIVKSKQARRGKGRGRVLARLTSATLVLVIVGALAALIYQHPEWFKPRMSPVPDVHQQEEMVIMPPSASTPAPTPTSAPASDRPVLSGVEEMETPPAALLEPQILPIETGDSHE